MDSAKHIDAQSKAFDDVSQSVLMNYIFLAIGLPSLFFAILTASGLYRRQTGTLPVRPLQRKWLLGVCTDFSETVGIQVGFVRFIILLYTPVGLGAVFYFIYYFVILNRAVLPPTLPEREPQITIIESHYYRS